jgi:hypothetical protein
MGSLVGYYAQCRKILCEKANQRDTITYSNLAAALGLKSARQQWRTVLGPIAIDETKNIGHDLTLVVVHGSGKAKGLGHYFSNIRSGQAPQSQALDPSDLKQVADYKRALDRVFNANANAVC